MQSWEATIHKMADELFESGEWDTERCYQLLIWTALRAAMGHPEWAQAVVLALPRHAQSYMLERISPLDPPDRLVTDKLAAILVNGTPVERMVV